jgi:hypothetical protein
MPVNKDTLEKAFHCLDQKAHKYEQKGLANMHRTKAHERGSIWSM